MCKTPNDAVIPVSSCLPLTTHGAHPWNPLHTCTNECNYRYYEHRPMRLLIMLENSGIQGERNPGVCNWFCHLHSLGLSSFTEGLKCSFSHSQLPGTHMNAVISVREGERKTSEFPPKRISRDLFSQGTIQHWPCIQRERKPSDKWSPVGMSTPWPQEWEQPV